MSFNDCKISESEIQTTGVQAQADTLTGSAADNKLVFDALPTLVIQKLNSLIDQMQQMSAAGQVGSEPFSGITATNTQDALEQLKTMIDGVVAGIIPGGSITDDMLQGPVSFEKGGTGATTPQGALANLGAGVRPNLLDNPFFQVNQRGQSTYNSGGYCLDCWKIVYISTGNYGVTVHDDYIEISAGSDRETRVDQILENPNAVFDKTVTGTVLLEDGSLRTGTAKFSKSDGSSYATETLYSDADFALLIQSNPSQTAILRLIAKQNKTVGIKGVKLEFGSEQTLAYQDDTGVWQLLPQPESDYATQLLRCQRYFFRSTANHYFSGCMYDASNGIFLVPYSVEMRTVPAVTVKNSGTLRFYDNTAAVLTAGNISVKSADGSGIKLLVSGVSGGKAGSATITDMQFDFSAEL